MKSTLKPLLTLLCLVLAGLAAPPAARAANWITPNFPPGTEPNYKPVPLYWFEVKETPFAYRKVIQVKPSLKAAPLAMRSSGYLYLFVDGKPVFSHQLKEGEKPNLETPLEADLTAELTPGLHAIVVSAPREGFALDGALEYAASSERLQTDASWQVMKFAPTTILEEEAWLQPAFKGQGSPVTVGVEFAAPAGTLTDIASRGLAQRIVTEYDDTVWRLGLLVHKGITVLDGQSYGWSGPARIDRKVLAEATGLLQQQSGLAAQVDRLRGHDAGMTGQALEPVRQAVDAAARQVSAYALTQSLLDQKQAYAMAAKVVWPNGGAAPPGKQQASAYSKLAAAWGHPLNHLNESRYDRLGWMPNPDLVDSQLGAWGLRVNPVQAPTVLKLDGKSWLFSTDPQGVGEAEKRQTIGYNIENQWARVTVPGSWTGIKEDADYKGAAWYRTRVNVPAEWQGHSVVLRFQANDSDRVWLNDTPIGATATAGVRNYTIPASAVRAGAENVLAFKITGAGEQRGLTGSVTLAVPELEGQQSASPTAQVLSTPLSPAVVLTPDGNVLEIRGWAERTAKGPTGILVPLVPKSKAAAGEPAFTRLADYSLRRDGKMAANAAVLWLQPEGEKAPDRPVLLVFEQQPQSIANGTDAVRITFANPGARVVAVRPWPERAPERGSDLFAQAIAFWQRAALAVPVNYMELDRVTRPGPPADFPFNIKNVPAGPVLQHTIVYDYLTLKDAWGTKPLQVAPVPTMCSYAMGVNYRGLTFDGAAPQMVQGGAFAPYRVRPNSDRISYSYPIEPFRRLAGFTSFMFSVADTGVPGNRREMELLKTTGANCYRPQNNYSTEKSIYYPPTEPRTRIEMMADECNRVGMCFMNNPDETLGGKGETVRQDYAAFMERMDRHWESIARQLHLRPFFDVSYDLINEPFDHRHELYNPAMKVLTARVRAIDPVHLCYIEPMEAWGAIEMLKLVEPTGDPLTVYSFHDYNFRLFKPGDRWPTEERDISNIYRQWLEAFRFEIAHGVPVHCGEFGGFDNSTNNELAQVTLMNDFFRIFDQFGMHFNYYSGRDAFARRADGSMALSNVVRAYRRYFKRGDFNLYYG